MKTKLIAALACSVLTSGCVITAIPDYPYGGGNVLYVPSAPVEIYEPSVIIVEKGVRHDRYYYERHPDAYRRDMRKYPDRFRHVPPPRSHGQPLPPPPHYGRADSSQHRSGQPAPMSSGHGRHTAPSRPQAGQPAPTSPDRSGHAGPSQQQAGQPAPASPGRGRHTGPSQPQAGHPVPSSPAHGHVAPSQPRPGQPAATSPGRGPVVAPQPGAVPPAPLPPRVRPSAPNRDSNAPSAKPGDQRDANPSAPRKHDDKKKKNPEDDTAR